jgi:hypothetical protein
MLGLDGSVGKNGQNKRHDVAVIQVALKSIKGPEHKPLYGGPIDGEFGRHRQVLEAAISLFQRHSRIPVTGRIDKMGPSMSRLEAALPSALRGMRGIAGTAVVAIARSDGAGPSDGGLRALKFDDDLAKELKVLRDAVLKKLGLTLVFRRRDVDSAGRIKVAVEVGGLRFLDSNLHPIAAPGRVPGPVVHEVTRLMAGSRRLKLQSRDTLNLITVRPEARSSDSTSEDERAGVDKLKRELALLEGEAANLARTLTTDARVRIWYLKRIKEASDEVMQDYRSGRLKVFEAARKAHGLRGQVLTEARNLGTARGRAIAEEAKKANAPFRHFEDKYAKRFNKDFDKLNRQQQIKVWEIIVERSGAGSVTHSEKAERMGRLGRVLWVATFALAAYSIIEAENKARETVKQGALIGGGIAGGAAGGAAAGLVCGPGVPICATAGIIIGGFLGALGVDMGFEALF